jgi:hypothetical protein
MIYDKDDSGTVGNRQTHQRPAESEGRVAGPRPSEVA